MGPRRVPSRTPAVPVLRSVPAQDSPVGSSSTVLHRAGLPESHFVSAGEGDPTAAGMESCRGSSAAFYLTTASTKAPLAIYLNSNLKMRWRLHRLKDKHIFISSPVQPAIHSRFPFATAGTTTGFQLSPSSTAAIASRN